jgi:hypothetical protein
MCSVPIFIGAWVEALWKCPASGFTDGPQFDICLEFRMLQPQAGVENTSQKSGKTIQKSSKKNSQRVTIQSIQVKLILNYDYSTYSDY